MRKTAAVCVAKLHDVAPSLVVDRGFVDALRDLLSDSNPMVVANAVAALSEVAAAQAPAAPPGGGAAPPPSPILDAASLHKLLRALNECTEWGQVFILDALAASPLPADPTAAAAIADRVAPRLQHANAAVSLSAVKVLLLCARATADPAARAALLAKAAPPLVTLLAAEPELQYVALRNIQLVAALHPECLQHEVRQRGGRGCGGCVRARARPSSPHAPLPLPCRSAPFSSSTTTPPTSKRRSWTCWWRWRRRRRSTRCSPSSKVRGAKRRGEEARGGGVGATPAGTHLPVALHAVPAPPAGVLRVWGERRKKKRKPTSPFFLPLSPPHPPEYASEVDVDFARKAVRCVGALAVSVDAAAERCVSALLDLVRARAPHVVQEAVPVVRDILRRYPGRYEGVLGDLCDCLDALDEPAVRGSPPGGEKGGREAGRPPPPTPPPPPPCALRPLQ